MIKKNVLILKCHEVLDSKIKIVEQELFRLNESQMAETKSSMGDKYETSREMMQRERTNLEASLQNLKGMGKVLAQIGTNQSKKVILGSLVYTDHGCFFLSVSLGEIIFESQSVFTISPVSPLGRQLIGKEVGEAVSVANKTQRILEIC